MLREVNNMQDRGTKENSEPRGTKNVKGKISSLVFLNPLIKVIECIIFEI